jgi:hypothetical protein
MGQDAPKGKDDPLTGPPPAADDAKVLGEDFSRHDHP